MSSFDNYCRDGEKKKKGEGGKKPRQLEQLKGGGT